MASVPQKDLRNRVGEVLRRAEAGEQITITVAGRPVAELGPVRAHRWVPAERSRALFESPADPTLLDDLRSMSGAPHDPFDPAG